MYEAIFFYTYYKFLPLHLVESVSIMAFVEIILPNLKHNNQTWNISPVKEIICQSIKHLASWNIYLTSEIFGQLKYLPN